jgi:hypothetical protein
MKTLLKNHIKIIEEILKRSNYDWKEANQFNCQWIKFFQHERLIHLLITLFFGIMFFISVPGYFFIVNLINIPLSINICFLAMIFILLVMLGFYIWHYYILENGIQKLYELDKKISDNSSPEQKK